MRSLILLLSALCIISCSFNPEEYDVNNVFANNTLVFNGYLGSPDGPKEYVTVTLIVDKTLNIRGYYSSNLTNQVRNFIGQISERKGDYSIKLNEINHKLEETGWYFSFQNIESDELRGTHLSPEYSGIHPDFIEKYVRINMILGESYKSYQMVRDVHLVRQRK